MHDENFEFSYAKPRTQVQGQRRFGTDLTRVSTNQRRSLSQSFAKSLKSDADDLFNEAYQLLHNTESAYMVTPNYMTLQPDINGNMRGILIDWLVSIQFKMKLDCETLYLTINIIDRFLSRVTVTRKELQLVGVCAMFIACKYEEHVIPEIRDLCYVTADAYNKDQVLDMEFRIIQALNFEFTIASPLRFLERYCGIVGASKEENYLARLFTELTLMDLAFLAYKPSAIAASCIYIVLSYQNPRLMQKFNEVVPYTFCELKSCIEDITFLISQSIKSSLQGIFLKYSHETLLNVTAQPIFSLFLDKN